MIQYIVIIVCCILALLTNQHGCQVDVEFICRNFRIFINFDQILKIVIVFYDENVQKLLNHQSIYKYHVFLFFLIKILSKYFYRFYKDVFSLDIDRLIIITDFTRLLLKILVKFTQILINFETFSTNASKQIFVGFQNIKKFNKSIKIQHLIESKKIHGFLNEKCYNSQNSFQNIEL